MSGTGLNVKVWGTPLGLIPVQFRTARQTIAGDWRHRVGMSNGVVCPKQCADGHGSRIKSVSPSDAGISPRMARAAGPRPHEKLSTCLCCFCVWRETFDPNHSVPRTEVLGEYGGPLSATRFLPEPRLKRRILDLEQAGK
jgi:hypothetical protein